MSKSLFLFLLLFLCTMMSAAQKNYKDGYIVTLNNDTLYGKINDTNKRYKSCFYEDDKGLAEYSPSQIKGYGIRGGKDFIAINEENTFAQILISGDMKLYKNQNDLFIQKNDQRVYRLESKERTDSVDGKPVTRRDNKWIGLVNILLFDCSANIGRAFSLDEKSLTKLVIGYNECTGNPYKDFLENKPGAKFEYGFLGGIEYSSIRSGNIPLKFHYFDKSYHSVDPVLGMAFIFSSPRFLERLSFKSEVLFRKCDFYSEVIYPTSTGTLYHETYIDLTTLALPLSFRYKVFGNNLFIDVGISYMRNLKSSTRVESEELVYKTVFTSEGEGIYIKDPQFGYWAGLELTKDFQKFTGCTELKFTPINSLAHRFTGNLQSISLSLIIIPR